MNKIMNIATIIISIAAGLIAIAVIIATLKGKDHAA